MNKEKVNIKHKVYDSVFSDLFSDKKYLIELYKALSQDDEASNITAEDINLLEINKVFINDLYNDLSFVVKNELFILVEAQSTYSKNIITRLLLYLSKGLEQYIVENTEGKFYSLYNEKIVEITKIKLYTIYTGSKKLQNHYISLSEVMKDSKETSDIELKVNVICGHDKENVLGQYIILCEVLREELKNNSDKEEAVKNTIKKCMNKGILSEYLENRKYEVGKMLAHSITTEDWLEYQCKEAEKRGKVEGMLLVDIPSKQIIELTGATEEEIEEIRKDMRRKK